MASQAAPASPQPLPSYARPTASSVFRESPVSSPSSVSKTKRLSSCDTSGRSPFRAFALSTAASRARAVWLGPFRIMDLPRELREIIYSYAGLAKRRGIDLRDGACVQRRLARLPLLLKIGGQLQMETAEHYFSASTFDIIVEESYLTGFFDWLRGIGEENRKRLLSNGKVTVRLQHSYEECRKDGHTSTYRAQNRTPSIDFLSGMEVMRVSRLTKRYAMLVSQSPSPIYKLDKWSFTSECPRVIWPDWDQPSQGSRHTDTGPRNEFSYFSLDAVTRLQAIVRRTLSMAEGSEPTWLDQGDRRELCIGKADKDIYTVTLPTNVGDSARMLYIREHKRRKR